MHSWPTALPSMSCLCSLNTENQEMLFGQARRIAETCTNHHPENINVTSTGETRTSSTIEKANTQVSAIAQHLPQLPGTRLKKSFVEKRADSWLLHLQQSSPFLLAGPGVWWESTEDGFHLFDGDKDTHNTTMSTPSHFRHHSIKDVEERQESSRE